MTCGENYGSRSTLTRSCIMKAQLSKNENVFGTKSFTVNLYIPYIACSIPFNVVLFLKIKLELLRKCFEMFQDMAKVVGLLLRL